MNCELTFKAEDQDTHKKIEIKRQHPATRLNEETCKNFCKIYQQKLDNLNHDLPSVESEKAGIISEYKIQNGEVSDIEGIGAFDDLMNFDFAHPGNHNIDSGGGKFNNQSAYLQVFGVENSVYDPFAREDILNQSSLIGSPFDTATSNSVLNVISEKEDRKDHIRLILNSLKTGGVAYFKAPKPESYIKEIEAVFGKKNVELKESSHLIIGRKVEQKKPSKKKHGKK